MTRRPLELYEALVATQSGDDEAAKVRALRRVLKRDRDAWPERVRRVVDEAGVGAGYLLRGVLSIATFAPDVRSALERGLPFAVARRVNGVSDPGVRASVLAPLSALAQDPGAALLPRGLSRRIDAEALSAIAAARSAGSLEGVAASADGWLAADETAKVARRLPGHVWLFTPRRGASRGDEALSPRVVEALVARLLPHGGSLVDVTAGAGTIAAEARRYGVRSWSGDVAPTAPFVHRVDARSLMASPPRGVSAGCADLLVVHPPTYAVWRSTRAHGEEQLDLYRDDVAAMIAGSLGVVRPGRHVVVISRPVRRAGEVWLATSHLAEGLGDAGVRVVGYVVAVASSGAEDWHVLIGRVPLGARA